MPIQFNLIPINWQVPGVYVEVNNSGAVQGTPALRKPVYITGTRLTTGTVAAGVVKPITGPLQGVEYFGRGSMLAAMCEAFMTTNPNAEVYAVACAEEGAGVAATKTITVTGTATEAGTIDLIVANRPIKVAVANGAVQNTIATSIETAIDADGDNAFTAGTAANVVTATCRWKGATGNSLSIVHSYYTGQKLPAGVTLAIADGVAGATDPDVAGALTAIGDEPCYSLVMPYTDDANMDKVELAFEERWGPMKSSPSHAIAAFRDTYANSQTYGNARNSPFSSVLATGLSPTPPWLCAAILAAVEVAENDPARPRQNRKLPRMLAPVTADRFLISERNLLLVDGMATYRIEAGDCFLERLVTTYQTKNGIDDPSYHDIETMRTLAYLRHSLRARFLLKYPDAKLADDGTNFGPGQVIVTPKIARGEVIALFGEWERDGLVEGAAQFKAQLIVERNANNPNQLDMFLPPDLINQLRVAAAQIGFKL